MEITTSEISRYVQEVSEFLNMPADQMKRGNAVSELGKDGLFETAEAAVDAAVCAQRKLMDFSLEDR